MPLSRLRAKRSLLTAVILALAAGGWIASGVLGGGEPPEPRKAPASLAAQDEVTEVRVRTVSAEPRLTRVVVTGRTQAERKVTVKAETHGRITDLAVAQGERVEAGDVLARLSEEDRPARLKEARALLEQRRIELEAAERLSEKGFRAETQLAAARAAYRAAEAAVSQAEVALGNTVIRAPFAGIVGETVAELGDYLASGDPLLRLVDLDPIVIVGQVSERNLAGLEVGTPGRARLVTGGTVEGRVRFIAPEADPGTRTFRVELEAENADAEVRDGVTAELVLPVAERPAHRLSPAVLTLNDAGVVGVKTVNEAGRVRFRSVEILADEKDGVWVAGLPETVTVITVGQEFVADGQRVRAVPEAAVEPGDAPPAAAETRT